MSNLTDGLKQPTKSALLHELTRGRTSRTVVGLPTIRDIPEMEDNLKRQITEQGGDPEQVLEQDASTWTVGNKVMFKPTVDELVSGRMEAAPKGKVYHFNSDSGVNGNGDVADMRVAQWGTIDNSILEVWSLLLPVGEQDHPTNPDGFRGYVYQLLKNEFSVIYQFNCFTLCIHKEAVADIAVSGSNDAAVATWHRYTDFSKIPVDKLKAEVEEWSDWDMDVPIKEIEERLLWIACHNIADEDGFTDEQGKVL